MEGCESHQFHYNTNTQLMFVPIPEMSSTLENLAVAIPECQRVATLNIPFQTGAQALDTKRRGHMKQNQTKMSNITIFFQIAALLNIFYIYYICFNCSFHKVDNIKKIIILLKSHLLIFFLLVKLFGDSDNLLKLIFMLSPSQ